MLLPPRLAVILAFCLAVFAPAACAWSCPFCNAVRPSFAQTREAAEFVALGEVTDTSSDAAVGAPLRVRVRQVLKGKDSLAVEQLLTVKRVEPLRAGALCLMWGTPRPDEDATNANGDNRSTATELIDWHYLPVDETSYAYFARAPQLRVPAPERLNYFARFLEHPDPAIAEDAYLEFGHAPFDVVAQSAQALPFAKIRGWLVSESVPQDRKGFYGLALGLPGEPKERRANAALLEQLVNAPDDDFRAGFGGIISGYLLVAGEPGLDTIEKKCLANPQAADGDVRSALAAIRFYHEFGKEIPPARLEASLKELLERPEFAAEATIDLARWQAWDALPKVVGLYAAPADLQPTMRRAVVGYLLACPTPDARQSLARLRESDPQGVADAEAYLKAFGAVR